MTVVRFDNARLRPSPLRLLLLLLLLLGTASTVPIGGSSDEQQPQQRQSRNVLEAVAESLREFCAANGIDCSFGGRQSTSATESYANESNDETARRLARIVSMLRVGGCENATDCDDDVSANATATTHRPSSTAWSPLMTVVGRWMNDNTFWLIVLQLLAILGLFLRRLLGSCRRKLEKQHPSDGGYYHEAATHDPSDDEYTGDVSSVTRTTTFNEHRKPLTRRPSLDTLVEVELEERGGGNNVGGDRVADHEAASSRNAKPPSHETPDEQLSISREMLRVELADAIERGCKSVRFVDEPSNEQPRHTDTDVAPLVESSEHETVPRIVGATLKRDVGYHATTPIRETAAETRDDHDENEKSAVANQAAVRWPYNYLRTKRPGSSDGSQATAPPTSTIASPPESVLSRGKTKVRR